MSKYDIHFQPVAAGEAQGFKCFEFGFAAALKVAGMQALVNRWCKTLFTPLGSDPLYPSAGTAFPNLFNANISQLTDDVHDIVLMAIADTNEQVREQDLDGFFADNERLQSAEILEYVQTPAGFNVWVLIKNVAGEALQFPVATLTTG